MTMTNWFLLAITGIALAAGITFGDERVLYFLSLVMIWSIFALGFDIVFGLTGMLSFGHAAFFSIGAYTFALLTYHDILPFSVAIVLAAVTGTILAVLFAMISSRINGVFLGLTTLALGQVVYTLIDSKLARITGGTDGLPGVPRPEFFNIDFYDNRFFAWLLVLFFVATLGLAGLLRSSPLGQVLHGIRQNEMRVEQLGFDIRKYKIAAFGISGAFAGIAGGLQSAHLQFVGSRIAHWTTSGDIIIMSILGGRGTLFGPIAGVFSYEWLREILSSYTEYWYGLLGIIFILFTLYFPKGLMGAAQVIRDRIRRWQT